jgi:hypothetical protein
LQYTTLLTVCTPSSVLLLQRETTMATAQPAGRSRRSASARIQTAMKTLFHRAEPAPTVVEWLTERSHASKHSFYQHFFG